MMPSSLSILCATLEALAEKAMRFRPYHTHGPGPWRAAPDEHGAWDIVDEDGSPVAGLFKTLDVAAHLAALDPATVLRLVAAIKAMDACAKAAQAREKYREYVARPAFESTHARCLAQDADFAHAEAMAALGKTEETKP